MSNKKRTKKANDDGHIFSLYSCVIIVVSVATLRPSKYCYESLTRSERAASSSPSPSPSQSAAAATPFCDTASTRTSETEWDCLGPFDILKTVNILHLRLVQPWSKRVSRLSRFCIHHISALSSPLYLPSQNG